MTDRKHQGREAFLKGFEHEENQIKRFAPVMNRSIESINVPVRFDFEMLSPPNERLVAAGIPIRVKISQTQFRLWISKGRILIRSCRFQSPAHVE